MGGRIFIQERSDSLRVEAGNDPVSHIRLLLQHWLGRYQQVPNQMNEPVLLNFKIFDCDFLGSKLRYS